jgi:sec-independent protein translocase protein TatA
MFAAPVCCERSKPMSEMAFFFGGLNPMEWVIILGIVLLLFGGSRLPQLAKALGQSKRAFREGQDEADAAARNSQKDRVDERPALAAIDDEELFEEARRRAARIKAAEGSRMDDRLLTERDATSQRR